MTNREIADEIIDTCPGDLGNPQTWNALGNMIVTALDDAEARGLERAAVIAKGIGNNHALFVADAIRAAIQKGAGE